MAYPKPTGQWSKVVGRVRLQAGCLGIDLGDEEATGGVVELAGPEGVNVRALDLPDDVGLLADHLAVVGQRRASEVLLPDLVAVNAVDKEQATVLVR